MVKVKLKVVEVKSLRWLRLYVQDGQDGQGNMVEMV